MPNYLLLFQIRPEATQSRGLILRAASLDRETTTPATSRTRRFGSLKSSSTDSHKRLWSGVYHGPQRSDIRRKKRAVAQTERDNERMNGNEGRMNETNGGSNLNGVCTNDRYNSNNRMPNGIQTRGGQQLANGQLLMVIVFFYGNFDYVIFLFLD